MPSPPIQLFLTSIASQPALRQRQEFLLRTLQVKKITFTSYDLASDEDAKRLWKRKAPLSKQQLPGILVGGTFPGDFSDFEEAVEYGELDTFLRLKESYDAAAEEDRPLLQSQPIGVPGAVSPLQMTPERLKTKILAANQSPLKGKGRKSDVPVNKRDDEFDVSTELAGFGLQGVKVTDDELKDLVAELGLDGDEAGDLVRGLSGETPSNKDEVGVTVKSETAKNVQQEPKVGETSPPRQASQDLEITGQEPPKAVEKPERQWEDTIAEDASQEPKSPKETELRSSAEQLDTAIKDPGVAGQEPSES